MVIAAGATVRAPFGLYLHRSSAAELVLQDLERPGAFVVRRAGQVADLVFEETRSPVEDSPGPNDAAGGSHARPARSRAAAGNVAELQSGPSRIPRATAASPHLSRAPRALRLVLGAIPPGEVYCSIGSPPYWAPCMGRGVDDAGAFTADPHCWYVRTEASRHTFYCPACAVARAAARAPLPAAPPPPAAPAPSSRELPDEITPPAQPWGDRRPIWGEPEFRERSAELRERWSERAAIVEYLACEPRAAAERIAYEMLVAELRPQRSAA